MRSSFVTKPHDNVNDHGGVRGPLALFGSGTERFSDRWPSDAVTVGGWVPELQDVFKSARIFVVPLTYGAG